MWQRIQTLFLGLALALTVALFFCNVSTVLGTDGAQLSIAYTERPLYLILTIICCLLLLCCLVSYKLRLLQFRITLLSALVLLGYQGILVYDYFVHRSEMVFSFTAVFPLVASILSFMAARKIFQDEIMVRAASRLRDTRKKRR